MARAGHPVVGIACDVKIIGDFPFHAVGEKYIDAMRDIARAIPILIPVTREPLEIEPILDLVDGFLFPGSLSNISPERYGGAPPRAHVMLDPQRDTTALPLLLEAMNRAKPIFCICRGMQELNVALGGTLDQHIEELPGRLDHREDGSAAEEVRYGPAHDVEVTPGGLLEHITGERRFKVNSLHSQAIAELAPGLAVEARASDGTIEAVSRPGARGYLLAVQWHPEWRAAQNPVSVRLLEAFGTVLSK